MLGLENIEFVLCRAEDYQSLEKFDCVTSSYLAKYADLSLLTTHCKYMLKAGGLLLMHDFTLPPNRDLLALWHFYFMTTRNTVARAFPSWIPIYEGLPKLIITTRCVSFSPSDVGSPQSIGFWPQLLHSGQKCTGEPKCRCQWQVSYRCRPAKEY